MEQNTVKESNKWNKIQSRKVITNLASYNHVRNLENNFHNLENNVRNLEKKIRNLEKNFCYLKRNARNLEI